MGKKRFKSYFWCLILNEFHDSSGTTHLTTQQQQQQVAGKLCSMTKASNKRTNWDYSSPVCSVFSKLAQLVHAKSHLS